MLNDKKCRVDPCGQPGTLAVNLATCGQPGTLAVNLAPGGQPGTLAVNLAPGGQPGHLRSTWPLAVNLAPVLSTWHPCCKNTEMQRS
jgi:hypothetical protein